MVNWVNFKLGEQVFDLVCGIGGFLVCSVDYIKINYVKIGSDY